MKARIKLIAIYILRIFIRIMQIFPIKKGRIIFFSYHGDAYSCNPMYISEYLQHKYPGQFEIIWAFSHPKQFEYLRKRGIKTIRYASISRFYYEATAQVSVNNIGSFSWIPLREGQLHINTWHGGGCYKKVSLGEKRDNETMDKTHLMTAQETSYMVSTSRYFTEYVIPHDFGYHGAVLNTGFPRNDILIHGNREKVRKKICQKYSLNESCGLILYAPTWRYEKTKEIVMPDFEAMKKAYTDRFGVKCVVLYRAHNWLKGQTVSKDVCDVTEYPDMQKLLLACDMLVTDYSSCMWDYSLTHRPCLLFTPDLDEYVDERGFDIDIYKWGFPVCKTDTELCDAIRNLDLDEAAEADQKHLDDLGSYDKGNACEQIGLVVHDFCFNE